MSHRKNLIALSLFNAATLLKEQETAPQPAPEAPPAPTGEAQPSGDVPVDEQGIPLTLDKLIDRMNIIRSGLSFEDPEVYGKLTSFYKGIPPEEKVQLHKQLKDVGAIVQSQNAPSEPGGAAPAPEGEVAQPPAAAPPAAAPPATA
jgi:hypothetical protein